MQKKINKRIAVVLAVLVAFLFVPSAAFAADYGNADTITYSTGAGEEVTFVRGDFNEVCEDLTGEDLDYVKFILPSSSDGTLYYDYDDGDYDSRVTASKKYYYGSSLYLAKVTFVPDEDIEGTVTIKYTGCDEDGNTYSGKVRITIDEDDEDDIADDITYSIEGNTALIFDEDDFDDVCRELMDEDLDYVKFTLPSSSKGTLYYDYESEDEYYSKVSSSTKYYYDASLYLKKVAFVPDKDYSGTVTVNYTGWDEDGDSYSGKVRITVDDAVSSDLAYTIDEDETVTFDEDEFYDLCEDLNDEPLDYVIFTLPSSSKGILYYDYDDGDYDSKVTASKKYYYDDSPYLSRVTFVPASKFSGICNITFKGYDTEGDSFSGTVEITVEGDLLTAETVNYTVSTGSAVYFKEDDFNNVCKKLKDNNLSYVKFTLPSASQGKLYYGYTSAKNYTSEVSTSVKYYYGSTPFLLNVAYVPAANATGTTTINYTGYDTEGSAFSGKVVVTIGGTATLKKSQYFSDVTTDYSWAVDYIDKLYQAGIVTGSNGTDGKKYFYPASKITRADFLLLLCRVLNVSSSSATGNFSDVAQGSYYYDAVAAAKALGIAQGSDNKFSPNAIITREDAMVLALRALTVTGNSPASGNVSDLYSYTDYGTVSSYARESIASLIKAGIITGGDDGLLRPKSSLTRTESIAIIYRIKY